MKFKQVNIRTKKKIEFISISSYIRDFVSEENIIDGLITVFVPHTTAAVTVNENADPSVLHDLTLTMEKLLPNLPGY
ncbi:MAG: secondary thiamine-phosphate synthase enzyme YjbQ, partial [Candidatus Cloacimonetes bacterium]|nr:secondary thiamine-phosphate synthase enzyme YjbQ [Candidatus Cloacimonadota bacterium]